MEKVLIEKVDNQGRGIAFINNKIAFVKGALPGDEVSVKIIKEKNKFLLCEVEKIITPSSIRVESKCPYSKKCGGCQFMDISYENSLKLKSESLINYLKKNNITIDPVIIENKNPLNYRNKLSLKIAGSKIGFYQESSNKIVDISNCVVANKFINDFLKKLRSLKIQNGFVTIKTNYNGELLVSINTKDKVDYNNICVSGLIINGELVKGEKFFVDKINDMDFEVNYDAFFQINPYISGKIFDIINENITNEDIVLDLYCGVGTLGICASKKAKKVYGLEVVKSAIINANNNVLINHIENASFKACDLYKNIKVNKEFNTLIIDPPRSGIDNKVMDFIKEKLPNKIIYVSCDYQTMVRDLKIIEADYSIKNIYILDMFSFSYHLECVCILEIK